jgi:2-keto-3-deoxy-L-rhamnonate aldolase RhmA
LINKKEMALMIPDLRARWAQGETALGTMVISMRNPAIAYALAAAGFDFMVVDCEHGSFSYETIEDLALACSGAGIALIVRIPEIRREPVLKCLEAGALGILAPQVETVEQAEALVSYLRYAPQGGRGVSLTRPHTNFRKVNNKAYMEQANQRNVLILQVESKAGLEHINELAAVPGVDAVLIGPNDLSQSLTNGANDNPAAVDEAIHTIINSVHHHGMVCGIHCSQLSDVLRWSQQGLRMLMWSSEISLMLAEAQRGLKSLREALT